MQKRSIKQVLPIAILFIWMTPIFSAVAKEEKSQPEVQATTVLNQKVIHSTYNDGDFEQVLSLIEVFTKANKTYSRPDSIFIAKHLAVVYSANPQTREKGKYFMYRMLEMMPSAELVDMFVSDEIDRIFDKVRKEFLTRQSAFGVDTTQISMPEKNSREASNIAVTTTSAASNANNNEGANVASQPSKPFYKKNTFWIAGGAGVALAGAAAIFILYSDEPASSGKTITISKN